VFTIERSILDIREGEQLLDVGCGNGRHSWGFYSDVDCSVCALDIGEDNLIKTKFTLRLIEEREQRDGGWLAIRGDAVCLPFRDCTFDKVICSEVLEHLEDDAKGMRELVRVLKDGGRLAVSVPAFVPEAVFWKLSKDYHTGPGTHVRIYRVGQLLDLLRQHGLRVVGIRRRHGLHSPYWLLRCIFGVHREGALLPSLYHRFLVWDMTTCHRPVRWLESLFDHMFPKSIVVYAEKG